MASTLLLGSAFASGLSWVRPAYAEAPAARVTGAWVRLPAVAGRPGAAYFEVAAPAGDRLVGASSPRASRVEMHSMTMTGGIMRMQAEPAFAVPANGVLRFAPGGDHLMLFGIDPALKPGDRLPISLRFERAGTVTMMAEAKAANSAGSDQR